MSERDEEDLFDVKEFEWEARKCNFLGLPWKFTKYSLNTECLYIEKGIFFSKEDEIRLYRINDISLRRTLWQKIIGTGTILVDSSDKSMPKLVIDNIKDSKDVRNLLSNLVEEARRNNHVSVVEGSGIAPVPPRR